MGKLSQRVAEPGFWTGVFTGIVAVTALVALWVADSQLKENHAEAQVQHLLALTQQFEQEPIATYRRGLAGNRLKNEQDPDELYAVLNFFETVGLLVDRGYLSESDVWDTFGYWVFNLNADARDIIEQQQRDDPNAFADFTSLVGRLQRIEAERRGTGARPSKEEVIEFYHEELSAGVGGPIKRHGHPGKQPAKQ